MITLTQSSLPEKSPLRLSLREIHLNYHLSFYCLGWKSQHYLKALLHLIPKCCWMSCWCQTWLTEKANATCCQSLACHSHEAPPFVSESLPLISYVWGHEVALTVDLSRRSRDQLPFRSQATSLLLNGVSASSQSMTSACLSTPHWVSSTSLIWYQCRSSFSCVYLPSCWRSRDLFCNPQNSILSFSFCLLL